MDDHDESKSILQLSTVISNTDKPFPQITAINNS